MGAGVAGQHTITPRLAADRLILTGLFHERLISEIPRPRTNEPQTGNASRPNSRRTLDEIPGSDNANRFPGVRGPGQAVVHHAFREPQAG